ncbi:hypothetical protein CEXT_220841, partial [Caerostris extrusa]
RLWIEYINDKRRSDRKDPCSFNRCWIQRFNSHYMLTNLQNSLSGCTILRNHQRRERHLFTAFCQILSLSATKNFWMNGLLVLDLTFSIFGCWTHCAHFLYYNSQLRRIPISPEIPIAIERSVVPRCA